MKLFKSKKTGVLIAGNYAKSYAQFGEDILIYQLFQMIPNDKTFLDIGAHHPYEISNTAIMHDAGWKGINVEPNPTLFRAFEEMRPNDINICAGIAGERGRLPFYMIDDWSGRNSFDKEMVEHHVTHENPLVKISKVINIDVMTLSDLIEQYAWGGVFPDYLSIDVENLEYEIISTYDLKANGPKVITMEVSSKKEEMLEYMKKMDYFLWLKIAANYTWVRNEYKEKIMR